MEVTLKSNKFRRGDHVVVIEDAGPQDRAQCGDLAVVLAYYKSTGEYSIELDKEKNRSYTINEDRIERYG
jgi:hypothetical protein